MINRISITTKMVILTVLLGAAVWGMTDWFQERHLREVFLAELMDEAARHAREDLALFDAQIQQLHLAAELMVHHDRLADYVAAQDWRTGEGCRLKHHFSPPPWAVEPSLLGHIFTGRYVVLISSTGIACEVYFQRGENDKDSLPDDLKVPGELLQKLHNHQPHLTSIGDRYFALSSKEISSKKGVKVATLMLAASVDDDFLSHAEEIHKRHDTTMVLMDSHKYHVIASSNPDRISDGTAIEGLKHRYLMVGKSFFDYGDADSTVHLASFLPFESVEKRLDSVSFVSRIQRLYLAGMLIVTFSLLTSWIAIRIKRLNSGVMCFTRKVSREHPPLYMRCDELGELEERFRYLAEAVENAHARIRKEGEERVRLTRQLADGAQKSKELELMRSVTDTLSVGIAVEGEENMIPFNNCMRQFVEQCNEIAQLMPKDQAISERTVHDRQGIRRTFVIMRHKVLGSDGFLVQEITIHKEAEDAMARAKEAAEAANQAKTNFLANMSHELRTPMHAILSYSNMGLKKVATAPNEKLRDYFSSISQSGKRLLLLLDDLLDIAKLEANHMEFNFAVHDLEDVIEIVKTEFSELLKERQIELIVERGTGDTKADIDHNRMVQVMRNLLSNAIKFTPSGKKVSIVTAESTLNGADQPTIPAISLTVIDEGIGIPEQELETIFDKFVQSSTTKTGAGGTGLGLSICKEIIEAHHGRIWAENNPSGGALFTILIPKQT